MSTSTGPPREDIAWRGAIDRALAPLHRAVAHDLRSPLNALRLNLTLVRRTLERDPSSAPRWLAVVEKESGRLESLLDAYLALTTASDAAEASQGDLGAVLSASEVLARCLAERRDIELSVAASPGRTDWSENILRRTVAAVLARAVDALPEGASLEVASGAAGDGVELRLTAESLPAAARFEALVVPIAGRVSLDGASPPVMTIHIPIHVPNAEEHP